MNNTITFTYTSTHPDYPSGTITFTGSNNIEQVRSWITNTLGEGASVASEYHLLTVTLSGDGYGSGASLFGNCTKLTTVDLSHLNSNQITSFSNMFGNCYKLTSVNLSNLDTSNIRYMENMFSACQVLTSLDISSFDTSNVINMRSMFWNCKALTTLDVSNFNISSVTNMGAMFSACSNLTTIYCDDDWNTGKITSSTDMFKNCTSLVGAIPHDSTKTDINYANPTTGYFTIKPPTITFTYTLIDGTGGTQSFTGNDNCAQLATFIHSGIADTLQSAILSGNGCGDALTADDYGLFDYCPKLSSVDLSNFNTTNVTSMRWMFDMCVALQSLDVSNFDTSNVTSMSGMFCMCGAKVLDLSNFDTSNVIDTSNMFAGCTLLKTIYCNDDWNRAGIDSTDMFQLCPVLVGAIPYDSTKTGITMANPTIGYFTINPPTTIFMGTKLEEAYFNGVPLERIYFNGVIVFEKADYYVIEYSYDE